jgi:hypothetical protein
MKKGPAGPFFYPTAGNSPATMQNPLPHGQGSLRPTFVSFLTGCGTTSGCGFAIQYW